MLAQNFKSADELRVTEQQKDALAKTLVMLETGRLVHVAVDAYGIPGDAFTGHFNMDSWNHATKCGSVCCIGGTAELIGGFKFEEYRLPINLYRLFYPEDVGISYVEITAEQAARALRSYLTTGDPKWAEAVA